MNNATKKIVKDMNTKLDRINDSMDCQIRTQKLREIMNRHSDDKPRVKADIVDVLRSIANDINPSILR
jgi:histone H3/H4